MADVGGVKIVVGKVRAMIETSCHLTEIPSKARYDELVYHEHEFFLQAHMADPSVT